MKIENFLFFGTRAFDWQSRGHRFDSDILHKARNMRAFFIKMQFSVYILKSEKNGRFYIGQTQDIRQRLEFHNTGRSKYTKNFGPWVLFASKIVATRSDAILLERKLKNLKSKDLILNYIQKHHFEMN